MWKNWHIADTETYRSLILFQESSILGKKMQDYWGHDWLLLDSHNVKFLPFQPEQNHGPFVQVFSSNVGMSDHV